MNWKSLGLLKRENIEEYCFFGAFSGKLFIVFHKRDTNLENQKEKTDTVTLGEVICNRELVIRMR